MGKNKPDLNELAQKIHADAVAHGYWDIKEPPTDTPEGLEEANLAKIHCELSEAVEQDCKGLPMEYHECLMSGKPCEGSDNCVHRCGYVNDAVTRMNPKPEGVAVELADFVIAFMDYCRQKGVKFPEDGTPDGCVNKLPELVNYCHKNVVQLADSFGWELMPLESRIPYQNALAAETVLTVADFVEWYGFDFWGIVVEKMEYNKTRPRLHGNRY